MSVISFERARDLLVDLIALPSVNPMGRADAPDEPVERAVNDYLEDRLGGIGLKGAREQVTERHENLLFELPGATDAPATLFEAHVDTVPADDWGPESLVPHVDGDLVTGRGACDDKGSLAAMVLAIEDIVAAGIEPRVPVLFLAAGDEEYAQTGIKLFRSQGRPLGRGIFGEPTSLVPVIQHKGTVRWDVTVHGRSAHTSRPENGIDAIRGAMRAIDAVAEHQATLATTHDNPLLTSPTLTVTMIRGGRTRNAVADECTFAIDFRVTPGMDPAAARNEVIARLAGLGFEVTHDEVQLMTPPLATAPDARFCSDVLEVSRQESGRALDLEGRPYGTDASWVSDQCPAIVLGPGNIDHAHAIGELVDVNEIVTCARIYRRIMLGETA